MPPATDPDAALWPHTGAVLAGGTSRRMGRPKHDLVLPDGRTMLEAVADALGTVCARVVVAGEVETALERVTDGRPDQGPLAGIEALLASGLDRQYLVCPCDLPQVTGPLLRKLTGSRASGATVFRVEGEAAIRPLPARLSIDLVATVRGLLDQHRRAVHQLMSAVETEVVALAPAEAALLDDVNTVQDYDAIRRSWAAP